MTEEVLVAVLKALAHPMRMRIMQALDSGERNVGEIDEAVGIGQPTLSQQLAVLRRAGLVSTRKEAKQVYYRIDDEVMGAVTERIGRLGTRPADPAGIQRSAAPGVANFARLN